MVLCCKSISYMNNIDLQHYTKQSLVKKFQVSFYCFIEIQMY